MGTMMGEVLSAQDWQLPVTERQADVVETMEPIFPNDGSFWQTLRESDSASSC